MIICVYCGLNWVVVFLSLGPFIPVVAYNSLGDVVIVWQLDLQLYMQSVPITTNVVSSNPAHGEVYSIHYVCQKLSIGRWFSTGTPVSSTYKTNRHDITEILLKVALNNIILTLTL
jgi:hypothetical protein